jgi:hypothetical protein
MLNRSPFLGPLFETMVASEIAKVQISAGKPRALYFFRDQQGLEVDFVVPRGNRRLFLIEAKASRTLAPQMGSPLARLAKANSAYRIDSVVVHRSPKEPSGTRALCPGVRATSLPELLTRLLQG